jgi:hypothetical protein
MHSAPQHYALHTDEPQKVSIGEAALIFLIGSLTAWLGVYWLFQWVLGGA